MAAFDTTQPATSLSKGRIFGIFANMTAAFAGWNDARITRNALSKLTTRELDDIGLTFGDIDMIAEKSAR